MQLTIILSVIGIIGAVRCVFCGNDFVSLGRHVWRCKARVTSHALPLHASNSPTPGAPPDTTTRNPPPGAPPIPSLAQDTDAQCPCGRTCKGRRGLKAHQRSCGFFKSLIRGGLLDPSTDSLQPTAHPSSPGDPDNLPPAASVPNIGPIKPGLKLPKTQNQWAEANSYFHAQFAPYLASQSLDTNSIVSEAQDTVYNYFAATCGTIPIQANQDLITRYANHSIKALKNALRLLKKAPSSSDSSELRYVSA